MAWLGTDPHHVAAPYDPLYQRCLSVALAVVDSVIVSGSTGVSNRPSVTLRSLSAGPHPYTVKVNAGAAQLRCSLTP